MYGLKDAYWSIDSLMLYILIIGVSYVILLRKKQYVALKIGVNLRRINITYLQVFFLLLFFLAFRTVGRDLNTGYYLDFLSATSISSYRDQTVEIGYVILNVVIKRIFDNYSVLVFTASTITLSSVFYVLNKHSKNINISIAILVYTSAFYFSGFSALRQYLAASICFLAFDAMLEKKKIKSLFLIFLASSFHVTSLIMIFPFFISFARIMTKRTIILSTILLFAALYVFRGSIVGMFGARYLKYSDLDSTGIGLRWVAYYFPLFALLYRGHKYDNNEYQFKLSLSIVCMGLVFELLGYFISIFGRLDAYTLPIVYIVAYYIKNEKSKKMRQIEMLMLFVYCAIRFGLFISDSYLSQNLMPYSNIFFSFK